LFDPATVVLTGCFKLLSFLHLSVVITVIVVIDV